MLRVDAHKWLEEGEDLAFIDVKGDVFDRSEVTKPLYQIVNADHGVIVLEGVVGEGTSQNWIL